jgi:hypothetical protein
MVTQAIEPPAAPPIGVSYVRIALQHGDVAIILCVAVLGRIDLVVAAVV